MLPPPPSAAPMGPGVPPPAPAVKPSSKKLAVGWALMLICLVAWELQIAPNSPNFWLDWEFGTLLTATLYAFFFYGRLTLRGLYKGLNEVQNFWIMPLLLGALGGMLGAFSVTAVEAIPFFSPVIPKVESGCSCKLMIHLYPVGLMTLAMACFSVIDFIFFKWHSDEEVRHEFGQGFYFNGVPVFVAFFVLLLFSLIFKDVESRSLQLKSFIGGAVAFEVLTGNTVFVILFWKPRA
jgi:hypothetical protein